MEVPEANLGVYGCLFVVETVVRELIIEQLEAAAGPRWYVQRLPADLLTKYRGAVQEARRVKWVQLVPHHPVYYLDFPDLRKILSRADNWKDGFAPVILKKDLFLATLEELDPIRNAVAHNRTTSESALKLAESAFAKVRNYLGEALFDRLAQRATTRLDIPDRLRELLTEAAACLKVCHDYARLADRSIWQGVRDEWWFDDSFIEVDVGLVRRYFELLDEYCLLPRTRGSGHLIETWVERSPLDAAFAQLERALSQALPPGQG
ncbi:MAG: hypothetical protein WA005_00430 [Candidatus Binataceae bacterium]